MAKEEEYDYLFKGNFLLCIRADHFVNLFCYSGVDR